MIGTLIALLVVVLVVAVAAWALRPAVAHFGAPDFVWKIVVAILVLVGIAYVLGGFGAPFWR